eukprot:5975085-Pleurochrysis_carterae.AAC.2
MENLGELVAVAHVMAGQGVPSSQRGFRMAILAREACAGNGSLSTDHGKALLRDLHDRLRRAAWELRRSTWAHWLRRS